MKAPGLARSAREDAKPFGTIGDDIELLHWDDAQQLAITQGSDAVVVDRATASKLIDKLADFLRQ